MGYWEEKRKYEEFKAKLVNPEAHLTERERERNRIYRHELSKEGGIVSPIYILGFIILFFGLILGMVFMSLFIFLGSIILGIIFIVTGFKKMKENSMFAWEKAIKKIPFKNSKRK